MEGQKYFNLNKNNRFKNDKIKEILNSRHNTTKNGLKVYTEDKCTAITKVF